MARTKDDLEEKKHLGVRKEVVGDGHGQKTIVEVPKEPKKKRKSKPGKQAIREIVKYQRSVELLLQPTPFRRLVKEISQDYMKDCRWTAEAQDAIQHATEAYITELFEKTNTMTIHRKREKIMPQDLALALDEMKQIYKTNATE